ncbi:MAG: Fic family protein [Propionicimonas sp.]|nr:Fic family protein [Propionicimonas sp.]
MSKDAPPPTEVAIPAVQGEEHNWRVDHHGSPASRTALAAANGPYLSAIPARIAEYEPQLPASLAADLAEAEAALSQFDQYSRLVLGSDDPGIGPMSSILLRTESTSSSQIENLTVGAKQLALAELGQAKSDNAQTVTANVRAMEAALKLADNLDESSVLTMHRELLLGQAGWEGHAGAYREGLVWVGTSALTPRGASHVAPQPERIKPAMADLVRFMQRQDLPAIAHTAIAHAQFETIHPFADGNGRTGRALVHAMLRAKGVMCSTTAPISAGLLRDTEGYFDALTAYRRGNAGSIIATFTDASLFAAHSGTELVDSLAAQVDDARQRMSGIRSNAVAWRVLPHLVANPVINAPFLVRRLGMNEMAAQRALDQLVRTGVLVERSGFRRNRIYQHDGILAVLDVYAQQLRRS